MVDVGGRGKQRLWLLGTTTPKLEAIAVGGGGGGNATSCVRYGKGMHIHIQNTPTNKHIPADGTGVPCIAATIQVPLAIWALARRTPMVEHHIRQAADAYTVHAIDART